MFHSWTLLNICLVHRVSIAPLSSLVTPSVLIVTQSSRCCSTGEEDCSTRKITNLTTTMSLIKGQYSSCTTMMMAPPRQLSTSRSKYLLFYNSQWRVSASAWGISNLAPCTHIPMNLFSRKKRRRSFDLCVVVSEQFQASCYFYSLSI